MGIRWSNPQHLKSMAHRADHERCRISKSPAELEFDPFIRAIICLIFWCTQFFKVSSSGNEDCIQYLYEILIIGPHSWYMMTDLFQGQRPQFLFVIQISDGLWFMSKRQHINNSKIHFKILWRVFFQIFVLVDGCSEINEKGSQAIWGWSLGYAISIYIFRLFSLQ